MPGPVQWVKNAPERATLLTIPAVWTAAEILHHTGVPGLDIGLGTGLVAALAYAGGYRRSGHDPAVARQLATAIGVAGGWLTLADVTGPLAGWHHAVTWGGALTALWAYRWLVRQDVIQNIRQRRADEAEQERLRAEWHEDAYWWGIEGSVLKSRHDTRLGERIIVDARGTARRGRAPRIDKASLAAAIEAHYEMPHGRVEVADYKYRGWYMIDIRRKEPWAEPIPHPVLVDDHEIELPYPATVRDPLPVGQDPITGTTLPYTLWTEELGALNVLVAGMKGSAKSNLLSCLRERLTAAPDALVIDINLSKAREEKNWAPACLLNAIGDDDAARAATILRAVVAIIHMRSQMPRTTPNLEPSPEHPHITVIIDEVQETVAYPELKELTGRIARSGRSECVSLVVSGQRGVVQFLGANVRTQVDEIWAGKFNRSSEINNALGGFAGLVPDMTTYGEGKPAVFASVNVHTQAVHKGRAWRLDQPPDLERIAAERAVVGFGSLEPEIVARLGQAFADLVAGDIRCRQGPADTEPLNRNHSPVSDPMDPGPSFEPETAPGPVATLTTDDLTHLEDEVFSGIDPGLRRQLDDIAARNARNRREYEATDFPRAEIPDVGEGAFEAYAEEKWNEVAAQTEVPADARAKILPMLEGEGTTIGRVADALGIDKYRARTYLERLRSEGLAEVAGQKRGARWVKPRRAENGDPK